MAQRYTVKLNSIEKVEQLLQKIYDQTEQLVLETQNGINKITTSTTLTDATIEEKTKFAKALNDFTTTKLKTIQTKLEVAKFMGEIIKHNNSLEDTLNDPIVGKNIKLNIGDWKQMATESAEEDPKPDVYDLK